MASETQGIQQLLAAEKKASEKVSEARKCKARKLKAAKEEAKGIIEKCKCEEEQKFKESEKMILGSRNDVKTRMDKHQEDVIKKLAQEATENKDKVIQRILELVCDVKPELHINYKTT
uniref:V-type proton ATPase subunit G n=1 Tax=Ciona intestinalis TaxID=7719 RepID=F6XM37_CIOIN|nr:probable V-type proton ATPase subunit G [Ciona intestinalis]|eukprot:XP_002126765.1 probable V-type proton ATPase subunit G [Ciona intestinalis]